MTRFIPYDVEVLHATVEQYGASVWPAQIAAFLVGALALGLILLRGPGAGRTVAAILAVAWAWTGGIYELLFYATINWAGVLHAVVFLLNALLLLWIGVVRGRLRPGVGGGARGWLGLAWMAAALLLPPASGAAEGAGLQTWTTFGITPDPTSVFTLGVLMTAATPMPVSLWVIPLGWTMFSGWWAWLLGTQGWFVVPAAGIIAAGVVVTGSLRKRG